MLILPGGEAVIEKQKRESAAAAVAKSGGGPVSPEQADLQRRQEQCFLLDNLEFVSGLAQSNISFSTILPVHGNIRVFQNKLENAGPASSNIFLNLTPAQLSTLVPLLKFYKVEDGGESEFKFSDKTDVTDIVSQVRPKGVGITDFVYKFRGTNEEEYKYNIEAELELYCNSLSDLAQEDASPPYEFAPRILDLLVPARPKKIKPKGAGASVANPEYFEIKVILGWQAPNKIPGFNPNQVSELQEELRAQQLTMILHTKLFDLDYRENGSIVVKISYQGELERSARNANILAPKVLSVTEQKIRAEATKFKAENGGAISTKDALALRARVKKEQQDSVDPSSTVQKYAKMLERLDASGRIYFVAASPGDLGISLSPTTGKLQQGEVLSQKARSFVAIAKKNEARLKGQMGTNKGLASTFTSAVERSNAQVKLASPISIDKKAAEKGGLDLAKKIFKTILPEDTEEAIINYFYLGDILEAAALESGFSTPGERNMILGPVEIPDLRMGALANFSLATWPVSLNLFMAFFVEKVIKNVRSEYSMIEFFRDLIVHVVQDRIRDCFGDYYKTNVSAIMPRITLEEFLVEEGYFDSFGDAAISVETDSASLKYMNTVGKKSRKIMIARMTKGAGAAEASTLMKAKSAERTKYENEKNIITLQLGLDHGILKRVTFSSADSSGLLEANIERIMAEGEFDITFLQKTYTLNITMFGTPTFKNGQSIKVLPSIIGSEDLSVAKQIFLAGYYNVISSEGRIRRGEYETVLQCEFTSPLDLVGEKSIFGAAKLTTGGEDTDGLKEPTEMDLLDRTGAAFRRFSLDPANLFETDV